MRAAAAGTLEFDLHGFSVHGNDFQITAIRLEVNTQFLEFLPFSLFCPERVLLWGIFRLFPFPGPTFFPTDSGSGFLRGCCAAYKPAGGAGIYPGKIRGVRHSC